MNRMKVSIGAIEYYLPDMHEDNNALLSDNPKWDIDGISKKTGIYKRYISKDGQCASDLGISAAERLFKNSSFDKNRIDALIFCTQSPDYFLPTTACIIQEKLGLATSIAAFDINLGCSGYVYGLAVGASLIESGLYSNILLICADTYTKYISKTDRTCRPIFSDAGSASLLAKSEGKGGIGPFVLGTDGRGYKNLIVSGGACRDSKEDAVIKMNGPEVFMFTMSQVPRSIKDLLRKGGRNIEDIDHFFFHQATKVVLDNIARHLCIPEEKIFRGYENLGNTVSASIPICLKQAMDEGRLKTGDQIMLVGFGVGYSWGACMVQWNGGVG